MNFEIFASIWTFIGCAALLAAIPGTVELLFLTAGGIMPRRREREKPDGNFRLAFVVPAHDEAANIEICLQSLFACADADSEIVVVADNCADATAQIAANAGARVLVRTSEIERGKGFALDFAFTELLPENFGAFIVIDADTVVSPNLPAEFRRLFLSGADAVQCRYAVANAGSSIRTRLMNVALLAFNVLRPRGRDFWNLSCGILGNGFALRAETLRAVPYAARSVVEDLEYHLALVRRGFKVRFADAACVFGEMPASGGGVRTQRARWEGGRLQMIGHFVPRLFAEVCKGRLRLLEPLLELLLMPLAFHVSLLFLAVLQFDQTLRTAAIAALVVVAAHILSAIFAGGGGLKDLAALACAPFYILWKLTLLRSLVRSSRKNVEWVRTERVKTGEKL